MNKKIKTIHIEDYSSPAYTISKTKLEFDIFDTYVRVHTILNIEATAASSDGKLLILNGERMKLLNVAIDDNPLPDDLYVVTDKTLIIQNVPEKFILKTEVEIDPYNNTWLDGIYKSGSILCSQNEPEGFRKITYYIDRPDVMSVFSVIIKADKKKFPFLLSNGNKIKEENIDNNRHLVEWHDPFPKPSYLFAFVAGDFSVTKDSFTTMSGRKVDIRIYVDHGNENKVSHTIDSLKRSMKWDEKTFGLEYDLDLFMIVAVDAFNMGAMENKGLNIFNSACALTNPDTATDYDYLTVESIVAHEYFHNWTGDRITLRDWFQLTLKEGLTVYRDGEYTADTYSRPIKRIESASGLRSIQFVEDAGPNAHPIQPHSYQEINNFYTATVYNKGAEVIRMIETLLGKGGFRRGMDLYVKLYDGKAITTEDFIKAMEDANDVDLSQFRRWYNQAGTPICTVKGIYDGQNKTFTLNVKQSCLPTADGSPKEPFYLPMAVGLLDANGKDIPLHIEDDYANNNGTLSKILIVKAPEQDFIFTGIDAEPIPSLFRNFSAPVKVEYNYTQNNLIFLLQHDSDSFNRYDAGQKLALGCLLDMTTALQSGNAPVIADEILDAFGSLIGGDVSELMFLAHALVLPSIEVINQELSVYDFKNSFAAREAFKQALALRHQDTFRKCYNKYAATSYQIDSDSVAKRRFRNLCLDYLSYLDDGATLLAAEHFNNSDNMTDRMDALRILCIANTSERDNALASFMERYKNDFNVTNKWFTVQASAVRNPDMYENICKLIKHPLFGKENPNRFRSIYGAFASSLPAFHDVSGRGYTMIGDITIEIDKSNSQVAAALGTAFKHYAKMPAENKEQMRQALEKIASSPDISTGLREIVTKTLE